MNITSSLDFKVTNSSCVLVERKPLQCSLVFSLKLWLVCQKAMEISSIISLELQGNNCWELFEVLMFPQ
jgi:hypothetical protein